MIIDTHQHNWHIDRFPYSWIKPDSPLHRDYLPAGAAPLMASAGVTGCVLVEGGAGSPDELSWLLKLADSEAQVLGVVGQIDLARDIGPVLDALPAEQRRWLCGVRIGASAGWETQNPGLRALTAHSLTCDLLVRADLATVDALITAHPDTTFILDHFAGARIAADGYHDWRAGLAPIAAKSNTVMKLSGHLTAAVAMPLDPEVLRPYVDIALELFGPARLLYGSDWPVCTRGGSYADTITPLRSALADLSDDEQAEIWANTAKRVYGI